MEIDLTRPMPEEEELRRAEEEERSKMKGAVILETDRVTSELRSTGSCKFENVR